MSTQTTTGKTKGFSADEKAAMRERAAEAKRGADREQGLRDLLAKIAEMPDDERAMGERIHALITAAAPNLDATTWYGMPAWTKNGKVLCHFQPAAKFKARYSTFGFSDEANLDEGGVWPVAFALKELTRADEERLAALVKQAAS